MRRQGIGYVKGKFCPIVADLPLLGEKPTFSPTPSLQATAPWYSFNSGLPVPYLKAGDFPGQAGNGGVSSRLAGSEICKFCPCLAEPRKAVTLVQWPGIRGLADLSALLWGLEPHNALGTMVLGGSQ